MKIKKKITLQGKEIPVAFTMGTVLSYEEIAGHSFFGETFDKLRDRLILVISAIYAADEHSTLKVEDLMGGDDWQEFNNAFVTVTEMAKDFFKLPDVVEEEEKAEERQQEGETKN